MRSPSPRPPSGLCRGRHQFERPWTSSRDLGRVRQAEMWNARVRIRVRGYSSMTPALAAHAVIHTCTLRRAGRPGVTSPPRLRLPHTQEAGAVDWRLVRQRARRRNGPVSRRTCSGRHAQPGPGVALSTPASRAVLRKRARLRTLHARVPRSPASYSKRVQKFFEAGQQHAHGRACHEARRGPLRTALKHARVPRGCPP